MLLQEDYASAPVSSFGGALLIPFKEGCSPIYSTFSVANTVRKYLTVCLQHGGANKKASLF